MRVSTLQLHDLGAERIGRQQAEMMRTQQQLATGRRLLTPADDPVAAAQALSIEQAKAIAGQFAINQRNARASLSLTEARLGDASAVLQDARQLVIAAGSATLADTDRRAIAIELRQRIEQLAGVANARDATGGYLFSGFQSGTQPFAVSASGATYGGDEGVRMLQLDARRWLPVSANGAQVFDRVPSGNGSFSVAPGGANAGHAVHDGGAVANAAAVTGDRYRIEFTVAGGITTYEIRNLTQGSVLATAQPYVSGAQIVFDGLQLRLTGAPAGGDRFDIAPARAKSLFAMLAEVAAAIEAPGSGGAERARLGNALASGLTELDQAQERVLAARTAAGAHLAEIDALEARTLDESIQLAGRLSALRDVDYAAAISRLSREQASLQAAQASWLRLTSASLFDLMR